ncbi:MAG: acetamidase/formamidase family protein [Trueperaceae bacterium]|nr:acetamidase/formamidase family protein [Trueperaceae bacterium]
MASHAFRPVTHHHTFAAHPPALSVAPGDTIRTHTVDAAGVDADGSRVAARGNPLTGPIRVEGAEPGDHLAVHLNAVTPNRTHGFGRASLAPGVLDPDFLAEVGAEAAHDGAAWQVDAGAGTVTLTHPSSPIEGLVLPLAPMLGCIGVAPAGGQAISTATSGPHGGNMDYRRLGGGVTVYLPVFVPGASLFVGDAHALQGDGEMSGTGVEISADVHLTVDLVEGVPIGWPRGEDDTHRFTLGNARPLDQATQHATTEMVRWLMRDHGWDAATAGLFLSQCVRYELGNMFDPAYTVACKVPHDALARVGA